MSHQGSNFRSKTYRHVIGHETPNRVLDCSYTQIINDGPCGRSDSQEYQSYILRFWDAPCQFWGLVIRAVGLCFLLLSYREVLAEFSVFFLPFLCPPLRPRNGLPALDLFPPRLFIPRVAADPGGLLPYQVLQLCFLFPKRKRAWVSGRTPESCETRLRRPLHVRKFLLSSRPL